MKNRFSLELSALALWIFLVPVMINTADRPLFPAPLGSRLQAAELAFMFLAAVWLFKLISRQVKFIFTNAFIPLSLYLFLSVLSFKNSQNLFAGIVEFTAILYLAFLFVLLVNVLRSEERLYFALKAWILASILVCLFGLAGMLLAYFFGIKTFLVMEYQKFPYLGHLFRVCSTFLPNAKFLSSYLTIAIPSAFLAFFLSEDKKARYFWLACLVLFLATLFFTFSRGWLGLSVCLYMISLKVKNSNVKFKFFKGILLAFVIIFGIFMSFVSVWRPINVNFKSYYDNQAEVVDKQAMSDPKLGLQKWQINFDLLQTDYFMLKKIAWGAFRNHPFLGVGLGGFNDEVARLKKTGEMPLKFPNFDPHSTFLGRLAETGILGLFSLFLLWAYIIKTSLNIYSGATDTKAKLIGWAFFSVIIAFIIQGIDMDIMNFRFLWFIFAAAVSLNNCTAKERR